MSEIAPEINLKSRPGLVQDDTAARIDPPPIIPPKLSRWGLRFTPEALLLLEFPSH